jgi:hypothetical protein
LKLFEKLEKLEKNLMPLTFHLPRLRREPLEPFSFTGNCPVRERVGDASHPSGLGDSIGRCWMSTYGGVCPRHGRVEQWIAAANGESCGVDERDLPPYNDRDYGDKELQAQLGIEVVTVYVDGRSERRPSQLRR